MTPREREAAVRSVLCRHPRENVDAFVTETLAHFDSHGRMPDGAVMTMLYSQDKSSISRRMLAAEPFDDKRAVQAVARKASQLRRALELLSEHDRLLMGFDVWRHHVVTDVFAWLAATDQRPQPGAGRGFTGTQLWLGRTVIGLYRRHFPDRPVSDAERSYCVQLVEVLIPGVEARSLVRAAKRLDWRPD